MGEWDMTNPRDRQVAPAEVSQILEAWRPVAEAWAARMAELARAVRPALEAFARLAETPQGRAVIAAYEADQPRRQVAGCHCLCVLKHPGRDLCSGEVVMNKDEVEYVRFASEVTGPVDVPMCPPCAQAARDAREDIVGAIDEAVRDWTVSRDAMRSIPGSGCDPRPELRGETG